MRLRMPVSTDVAAFGIWDSAQPGRAAGPVSLEALAQRGEACIVNMGGDCGGAVELFVDEEIPAALVAESDPVAGERTVAVRSGSVAIDGVERFGAEEAACSRVPDGVYLARIRLTRSDDELPEPESEKEIRRSIGAGDVEYYDRTNRNSLLIALGVLALGLVLLLWLFRWFVAVPAALILFFGYFHLRERQLKRNPRYQAIAEPIVPLRLAGDRPLLAVQLSRWQGELRGGPPLTAARDEHLRRRP